MYLCPSQLFGCSWGGIGWMLAPEVSLSSDFPQSTAPDCVFASDHAASVPSQGSVAFNGYSTPTSSYDYWRRPYPHSFCFVQNWLFNVSPKLATSSQRLAEHACAVLRRGHNAFVPGPYRLAALPNARGVLFNIADNHVLRVSRNCKCASRGSSQRFPTIRCFEANYNSSVGNGRTLRRRE